MVATLILLAMAIVMALLYRSMSQENKDLWNLVEDQREVIDGMDD